MFALDTIDSLSLVTVTGGQTATSGSEIFSEGAGQNRFRASGNIEGSGYGVTVRGQGEVATARSNYGACLDKATTPEAMRGCLDVLRAEQGQPQQPAPATR